MRTNELYWNGLNSHNMQHWNNAHKHENTQEDYRKWNNGEKEGQEDYSISAKNVADVG